MRNTYFRTWYMARKTEKVGKFEMSTVGHGIWQENWKTLENEKHPLHELKNDEITERREKWEMHTVGPGIWRENWKSQNEKYTI